MERRAFLQHGLIGGGLCATANFAGLGFSRRRVVCSADFESITRPLPPIRSIVPVVGDGHWIWNDPPDETGYLEPREYEVEIGVTLEGRGSAQFLKATTPVPIEFAEQKIRESKIKTNGCQAIIRPISNGAAQLFLTAPVIAKGQTIFASVKMGVTLLKQYRGFSKEQFEPRQPAMPIEFKRQYLFDSPGMPVRASSVRKLQKEITERSSHPWDTAHRIYLWVWENIKPQIGRFKGVVRALQSRAGDCEERAACFVALCRASGIPARLVWVPNHNWAEFFLVDTNGVGQWIPAHTAAYSWFGWTGAHELVIQKGDNLYVPEKKQPLRLLADWMQWKGSKPVTRFSAELRPLPRQYGEDPGPGARSKDQRGEWLLQKTHKLDLSLRDSNLGN